MSPRNTRRKPKKSSISQLPWQEVVTKFSPLRIMSQDEIESIHHASLDVLENVGMKILHEDARKVLKKAGLDVDESTQMVYFDRDLVSKKILEPPKEFTLRARNPKRDIKIGGNHIVFSAVGGPAYCSDLDKGRRRGSFEDLQNYMKIIQSLNIIHQEGGMSFETIELPPETRYLDLYLAQFQLLDKNCQSYPMGAERTRDCIDMHCIALECTREELAINPSVMGVINTNSPMQLDTPMSEAAIELASSAQVTCITPFTLSGAMAPIKQAGTLVQQNAEVLALVTLTQLVRPGAPIMYGSFSSNVDMRSGSPAFGTPEYIRSTIASGQLARFYGFPYRSSNTNASNAVDAQAVYESSMSLWATVMSHANLVNHAAGWLESGLTASFEKLIIDAEMLQIMSETLKPIEINSENLGVETIKSVGPGGHFFATDQTLDHYATEFYTPMISDWNNFENWEKNGSITTIQRANKAWKTLLKEYQQPKLDPSVNEALITFVEKRKEEIINIS